MSGSMGDQGSQRRACALFFLSAEDPPRAPPPTQPCVIYTWYVRVAFGWPIGEHPPSSCTGQLGAGVGQFWA